MTAGANVAGIPARTAMSRRWRGSPGGGCSRCGLVDHEGGVAGGPAGYRVVAAVGGGVDGDDVGAGGEVAAPGDGEAPAGVVQGGDPAGFGRYVQAVRAGVVGQDVGVWADGGVAGDLPGGQVHGEQGGVAVAGDEREPGGGVQGQAVVVVAAGQRYAPDDRQGRRVDHGEGVS